MNTSELWLTQEEISLMLDGRLTWDQVTQSALGIEEAAAPDYSRERIIQAHSREPVEQDYSEETTGGLRLAGFSVFALVGGTGVLTFSLWFYFLLR